MKAFKPPFVLFHLGNYDLISNKMIGIVGKIDETKIKVLKFLASNQYVMNFKLSSMEDNDLELLQKNKIPCIIFCDDIMIVKQGSQYQKYLKEDKKDCLNETMISAGWFGETEIVKFLIENGADIDYKNQNGLGLPECAERAEKQFKDSSLKEFLNKQ